MQSIIALIICVLSFLLVIFIYYKFIHKQCHLHNEIIYLTEFNDITQRSPNPPPYQSNEEEEPPPYSERQLINTHLTREIQSFIIL
jgi:hypothetical protein